MSNITHISFTPTNNDRLRDLCGPENAHLQQIEEFCNVKIHQRANAFHISGNSKAQKIAENVLNTLYKASASKNSPMTKEKVFLCLKQYANNTDQRTVKPMSIHLKKEMIAPRSEHQASYIDNIHKTDINFAVGPAGTGKTYLAVAAACEALEQGRVHRLIFVRPAVEAGEKLGFLPGDLAEKILPYLRPLYDALYEMLGVDQVEKLMDNHIIEIAPLAFMRGRTLSDAFIILDEAQNTTIEQMKMFLTRIGFGSTAVITGDTSQVDLPKHISSGLNHAINLLEPIESISFTYFDASDTVRHPIVQAIIEAYERDYNEDQ